MRKASSVKADLDSVESDARERLGRTDLSEEERQAAVHLLGRISKLRRDVRKMELVQELIEIPKRSSRLIHRVVWAAGLAVLMPVLWPVFMSLFAVVLALLLVVMGVLIFATPFVAYLGFPEDGNETLEVTVPRERAEELRKRLEADGVKVKVSS